MKAFITVMGRDKVGIIARVSAALAERDVNIEDISQTILQGTFTMIMAVDLSLSQLGIAALSDELKGLGEELGVEISLRSAAIFNAMHRI